MRTTMLFLPVAGILLSTIAGAQSYYFAPGSATNAASKKQVWDLKKGAQLTYLPRPVPMGVAGGNDTATSGKFIPTADSTLGALFMDAGGNLYIGTANHAAGRNALPNTAQFGDSIVQPGPASIGALIPEPSYEIAKFFDEVPVPVNNTPANPALVDGALELVNKSYAPNGCILQTDDSSICPAAIASGIQAQAVIANIGPYSSKTTDTVMRNTKVQMMGAQSGFLRGKVTDPDLSILPTTYGTGIEAYYANVIELNLPTSGGDSGAMILSDDQCPQIIGILIAGTGVVSYANPIGYFLNSPVLLANQVSSPLQPVMEPVGGCMPNHSATAAAVMAANSALNPDGSFAVSPAVADRATASMWNNADINPNPQDAIDQANGQAVVRANLATLAKIPGYVTAYAAGDHLGRLTSDGRLITIIVVIVDDVRNPGVALTAGKTAPQSLSGLPVLLEFVSSIKLLNGQMPMAAPSVTVTPN